MIIAALTIMTNNHNKEFEFYIPGNKIYRVQIRDLDEMIAVDEDNYYLSGRGKDTKSMWP